MDTFYKAFNDLLVHAFHSVLKLEEQMLHDLKNYGISIGEIHLIEVVGKSDCEGISVSQLARELSLTLPSITVAVKKLEKKEFLKKEKNPKDGRNVLITLTPLGEKIDRVHRHFHEQMVLQVTKEISTEEKALLLKTMEKLNCFFDRKLLH